MKTHCKQGHALSGSNVRVRVYRGAACNRCLECERHRSAKRNAKKRTASEQCECGRDKSRSAEACPSCLYLDGDATRPLWQFVIAELRTTPELTFYELVYAVYGRKTQNTCRSMMRILGRMIETGRVIRRKDELVSISTNGNARGSFTRWMYRLSAPARGEIARAA